VAGLATTVVLLLVVALALMWPGDDWRVAAGLAFLVVIWAIMLILAFRAIRNAEQRLLDRARLLQAEVVARERAAERFRAVIEGALDAIIAIDAEGRIETFNGAAERIFGYTQAEVTGQNVRILMPEPYRHNHDSYIQAYRTTRIPRIIGTGREVEAIRKDGTVFPIDLSISEMHHQTEGGFIGVIRDITERRDAENRVRELIADLAHVSRLSAMGQFASSIAHELNQPLTAVVNYNEAVRALMASDPAKASDLAAKVTVQAERAGEIVRRLRSLVEKGTSDQSPQDISTLVEEACALATIGSKVAGVEIAYDLPHDLPLAAADRIQIQQVVVNLVRNAIEVLGEAPVRRMKVQVRHAGPVIEVAVSDTGPGLSPVVAENLFKPFVTTKPGGMGMGLSISQSIIEAHGGTLWAESAPGGGTTFKFTLPVIEKGAKA